MTLCTRRTAIVLLLCSLALPAWGQHYYLYEPKAVIPDAKRQANDGILVKDVPVQEGDTLYGISRKYSGYGMYYPQILLFNDIKNPNLIHTGDTLKIPLPHGETPKVPVSADRPRAKSNKRSATKEKRSSAKATRASEKNSLVVVEKKSGEKSAELSLSDLKKIGGETEPRNTKNRKSAAKMVKKGVDDQIPAVSHSKVDPIPVPQKVDVVAPRPVVAASDGQLLFEKAVKAYRQDDCRTALELFDRYLANNPGSSMAADASLYKADCYLKLSIQ